MRSDDSDPRIWAADEKALKAEAEVDPAVARTRKQLDVLDSDYERFRANLVDQLYIHNEFPSGIAD